MTEMPLQLPGVNACINQFYTTAMFERIQFILAAQVQLLPDPLEAEPQGVLPVSLDAGHALGSQQEEVWGILVHLPLPELLQHLSGHVNALRGPVLTDACGYADACRPEVDVPDAQLAQLVGTDGAVVLQLADQRELWFLLPHGRKEQLAYVLGYGLGGFVPPFAYGWYAIDWVGTCHSMLYEVFIEMVENLLVLGDCATAPAQPFAHGGDEPHEDRLFDEGGVLIAETFPLEPFVEDPELRGVGLEAVWNHCRLLPLQELVDVIGHVDGGLCNGSPSGGDSLFGKQILIGEFRLLERRPSVSKPLVDVMNYLSTDFLPLLCSFRIINALVHTESLHDASAWIAELVFDKPCFRHVVPIHEVGKHDIQFSTSHIC